MILFENNHTLPLPGFEMVVTRSLIAQLGALCAGDMLRQAGYQVFTDFRANHLRVIDPEKNIVYNVEVRIARCGQDGAWRFTLRNEDRTCSEQDILLLLAVIEKWEIVPFVIPLTAVGSSHLVINSNPATWQGRYSRYRVPIEKLALGGVWTALD